MPSSHKEPHLDRLGTYLGRTSPPFRYRVISHVIGRAHLRAINTLHKIASYYTQVAMTTDNKSLLYHTRKVRDDSEEVLADMFAKADAVAAARYDSWSDKQVEKFINHHVEEMQNYAKRLKDACEKHIELQQKPAEKYVTGGIRKSISMAQEDKPIVRSEEYTGADIMHFDTSAHTR